MGEPTCKARCVNHHVKRFAVAATRGHAATVRSAVGTRSTSLCAQFIQPHDSPSKVECAWSQAASKHQEQWLLRYRVTTHPSSTSQAIPSAREVQAGEDRFTISQADFPLDGWVIEGMALLEHTDTHLGYAKGSLQRASQ
mmetsp:Transcript_22703/g.51358  ORF Transcript_22703/g.51358 Transcript_22703/m.51358 type:complete len:140 (-) Transcript_22703:12-431(-)